MSSEVTAHFASSTLRKRGRERDGFTFNTLIMPVKALLSSSSLCYHTAANQGHHTGGHLSCFQGSAWHVLFVRTKAAVVSLLLWTSGTQRCGLFSILSRNSRLFPSSPVPRCHSAETRVEVTPCRWAVTAEDSDVCYCTLHPLMMLLDKQVDYQRITSPPASCASASDFCVSSKM